MAESRMQPALFVVAVIAALAVGVRAPTLVTRMPTSIKEASPLLLIAVVFVLIYVYMRRKK